MILSFINIRKVPREMLKTSGFALGFQHLPRDLVNVNEWKIMFDPYIILSRQRTTKVLIKLHRRAGWSAPLLLAYDRFSHDVAHIIVVLGWYSDYQTDRLIIMIKCQKLICVHISEAAGIDHHKSCEVVYT